MNKRAQLLLILVGLTLFFTGSSLLIKSGEEVQCIPSDENIPLVFTPPTIQERGWPYPYYMHSESITWCDKDPYISRSFDVTAFLIDFGFWLIPSAAIVYGVNKMKSRRS